VNLRPAVDLKKRLVPYTEASGFQIEERFNMRRMVQFVWMKWESLFEWSTRMRSVYSGEFGICKMFVTKYYGKRIECEDGTSISAGDWVGELHLDNEKVLLMLQSNDASRVALTIARMARISMRQICAEIQSNPKLSQVKALQGITLLHRGIIHGLGFEKHEIEAGQFRTFSTSYLRLLIRVFQPGAKERIDQHAERLVPMRLVLTRRMLVQRFSLKESLD